MGALWKPTSIPEDLDTISQSQKCRLNLKSPNLKCHTTQPAREEAKLESNMITGWLGPKELLYQLQDSRRRSRCEHERQPGTCRKSHSDTRVCRKALETHNVLPQKSLPPCCVWWILSLGCSLPHLVPVAQVLRCVVCCDHQLVLRPGWRTRQKNRTWTQDNVPWTTSGF